MSPHGRDVVEDFVWSLSFSNLLAIPLWGELDSIHDWRLSGYWSAGGPKRTLELATMAGVLVVALLIFAILRAVRLLPAHAGQTAVGWMGAAAVVALAVGLSQPVLSGAVFSLQATGWASHMVRRVLEFTGPPGVILPACFAGGTLIYLILYRRILLFSLSRGIILVLAPLLAITFGTAARYAYAPPAAFRENHAAWTPRDLQPASSRTLWLVFDELDQRLAFEERPRWLRMPEFDRFRSESLHADQAVPPANFTLKSLPALTTGEFITEALPEGACELKLTFSNGREARWSKEPTVFTDAAGLGLQSGIVGWYHPYCRVLGKTVTCAGSRWRLRAPRTRFPGGSIPKPSASGEPWA